MKPVVSLTLLKNCWAMMAASEPYRKKSYHSNTVPRLDAMITLPVPGAQRGCGQGRGGGGSHFIPPMSSASIRSGMPVLIKRYDFYRYEIHPSIRQKATRPPPAEDEIFVVVGKCCAAADPKVAFQD
jgi:hypothetical protein